MKPTPHNTSAALAARYHHQPWFVGTTRSENFVRLLVTDACPFREHRRVADVRIVVVVTTPGVEAIP